MKRRKIKILHSLNKICGNGFINQNCEFLKKTICLIGQKFCCMQCRVYYYIYLRHFRSSKKEGRRFQHMAEKYLTEVVLPSNKNEAVNLAVNSKVKIAANLKHLSQKARLKLAKFICLLIYFLQYALNYEEN